MKVCLNSEFVIAQSKKILHIDTNFTCTISVPLCPDFSKQNISRLSASDPVHDEESSYSPQCCSSFGRCAPGSKHYQAVWSKSILCDVSYY